jgi:hypothetical protein
MKQGNKLVWWQPYEVLRYHRYYFHPSLSQLNEVLRYHHRYRCHLLENHHQPLILEPARNPTSDSSQS